VYTVRTMENKKNNHVKLLMYAGTLFLLVLSILAITATAFVMKGNQSYDENTISVTGRSEVNAAPDVATFSFTVKETNNSIEVAQGIISEKVSIILNGLENADVEEEDIKTQSYTMYPKYEWVKVAQDQEEIGVDGTIYFPGQDRKQVQVGFDVSQNVTVKLRDFDKVGEVLTLFGETGVENLNGPNFQIDEPDELQEEAREMAIKEAKEKAKQLAKDLGVRLGKVVSFNEGNNGGYYPEPYARGYALESADYAVKASPELPVGENTITSNVTIIYTIK
jgi:uncharacterized protein YggE